MLFKIILNWTESWF